MQWVKVPKGLDDIMLCFYKWDEYLKLTPKQRQILKKLLEEEEKRKAEEEAKTSNSMMSGGSELAKDCHTGDQSKEVQEAS